jgi:hypothetical protein
MSPRPEIATSPWQVQFDTTIPFVYSIHDVSNLLKLHESNKIIIIIIIIIIGQIMEESGQQLF